MLKQTTIDTFVPTNTSHDFFLSTLHTVLVLVHAASLPLAVAAPALNYGHDDTECLGKCVLLTTEPGCGVLPPNLESKLAVEDKER